MLLNQLQNNKGRISSALGKELAKQVLSGREDILQEAFELIHHDNQNVRSGAAKIIEKVAEERPELVIGRLSDLRRCMDYKEAQTRWMVMHVAGLCAKLQPDISRDFFDDAVAYLDKKHGTVLNDRAITYLGYLGAVSVADCSRCFPNLMESFERHPNRRTRVFESLIRMSDHMSDEQKRIVLERAVRLESSDSPTIGKLAKKVIRMFGSTV